MRQSDFCESVTDSSELLVRQYRAELDDESDRALMVVHYRGGQVEFDLGRRYALSADPIDRIVGARILGQLGWGDDTFHAESVDLLLPLLDDPDEDVVACAAYALGHRRSARGVPVLLPFVRHQNAAIRLAVVSGLSCQDDPAAIDGLIELSKDLDRDVRNWAAFGLGTMTDFDSAQLRDALVLLLDDPDAEIRGEAMIGLAKRKDPRVMPALTRELKGDFYGNWCLEAAELCGFHYLLPLIVQLRENAANLDAVKFSSDFDRAIAACSEQRAPTQNRGLRKS